MTDGDFIAMLRNSSLITGHDAAYVKGAFFPREHIIAAVDFLENKVRNAAIKAVMGDDSPNTNPLEQIALALLAETISLEVSE